MPAPQQTAVQAFTRGDPTIDADQHFGITTYLVRGARRPHDAVVNHRVFTLEPRTDLQ